MYSSALVVQKLKQLLCCVLGVLPGMLPMQPARGVTCTGNECKVNVIFQGTYAEETCDVSINGGGARETVTLPSLSSNALQISGTEAGETAFGITLKGCPISRTVSLRFVSGASTADTATGNLINTVGTEYSQNVQIRIRYADRTQMIIDNSNYAQDYTISALGEDVSHDYYASYYANGNYKVTPGLINSTANIDLVYR